MMRIPTVIGIYRAPIESSSRASPVEDVDHFQGGYEGLELTVYGLEHTTPQSAANHLRRIIDDIKAVTELNDEVETVFRAITVRQADTRNVLDYAYVSLSQDVIAQPRADILQALRKTILDSHPNIRAHWRTHAGLDKTRRLSFGMETQKEAQEMVAKLNEWLERKGFRYMTKFVSAPAGSWRVTYDFFDPGDVEAILASPPVIGGRTFYPNRPRFIIPSYGYQIAILGCRDWQSARATLDKFIRDFAAREDGLDPVVYSHMELGGDVYTAVLRDWASTMKVADGYDDLKDFLAHHPLGRHINPVPQPGLLYVLNGSGLFFRQSSTPDRSSFELRQFRHELDAVRQQGLESMQTLFTEYRRTNDTVASVQTGLERILAGMARLAALQSLDARLVQAELSLSDARQQQNQCNFLALLGDRIPADLHEANIQRLRECNDEIDQRRKDVQRLRAEHDALALTAADPPVALPTNTSVDAQARQEVAAYLAPPPAPAGPSAPTMQLSVSTLCSSQPIIAESRLPPGLSNKPWSQPARAIPAFTIPLPVTQKAPSSPHQRPSSTSRVAPLTPLNVLLALLCLSVFLPLVSATTSLSAITINCNGLAHAGKQHAVSSLISVHDPHIWVINETKSPHPMRDRLHTDGYNKYEAVGAKNEHGRGGKWGVIVGVKRFLHSQRLVIDDRFNSRIVALDIVITTNNGRGYVHRFIGVYAPWDPGVRGEDAHAFWTYVATLCETAPHSWTVLGDFNATLLSSESVSSTTRDGSNRAAYSAFLSRAHGIDIWLAQNDSDARIHYTCKSSGSIAGQSVIDRAAISRTGIASASCATLSDFIPATDHRPVSVFIALNPPVSLRDATTSLSQSSQRPSYPPRFLYPKRSEKDRFTRFARLVDEQVAALHLAERPISDDDAFEYRYHSLTHIFRSSGLDAFELPRHNTSAHSLPKPTNPRIRSILTETKHVNRLISAIRRGSLLRLVHTHLWARRYQDNFITDTAADGGYDDGDFLSHLKVLRRSLARLRYRAEHEELEWRATQSSRARINSALLGGSCKRLYVHSLDSDGPPAALSSPDDNSTYITDASGIKDATVQYFKSLFHRTPRRPSKKPWMDTASIRRIRQRTADAPFEWPRPLTLEEFRVLLRKGNPRPSPGPDLWEKWCVKALSDTSLSLVLDLVNYEIVHSHFPACVKPAIISTIFKRGLRTDLSNYRGITCSNFVKNVPFSWLNHLLSFYVTSLRILPETQIATQPGVQARDLTSFLSQIDAYAHRHNQPLFVLRRDQRKGFDRLEPEGFYDAVRAYGLPSSLIDLDCSAQDSVPYRVKTIHGLTDSFVLSGITQQGGPFSPLKSTLTTSMLTSWLDDATPPAEQLRLITFQSRSGKPHTPDDTLALTTQMCEAMDDSLIIRTSLTTSQSSALLAERFQAAYGWETNWSKSLLYVTHPNNLPPHVMMPSVDPADPDSETVLWHPITVATTFFDFLRVMINDPTTQAEKIRRLIHDFTFPNLPTRLPITALRRIISQCLIARIRPYLSYQPLPRATADELDRLLAHRIHEYLGFPFQFNHHLLFAPLSDLGMDFPSIARINDAAAVQGLLRDLTHHVSTFRVMARITMADWTCMLNNCKSPLEGTVIRSFQRVNRRLPSAWITAAAVLKDLGLAIYPTDQSYLYSGDVALRHLIRCFPSRPPAPNSLSITNLERAGLTHLSQVATFSNVEDGAPPRLQPLDLSSTLQGFSAARDWARISEWLRQLTLADLVDALAGSAKPPARLWTMALPRDLRRDFAENQILAAATLSPHQPLPSPQFDHVIASDASAIRRPLHLSLPPTTRLPSATHVTFATASTTTSLLLSISPDTAVSSLHGEVFGLVAASLLHLRSSDHHPHDTLYTDHLNSARFVNNRLLPTTTPNPPPFTPARALYHWLFDILSRSPYPPTITYTPAHTAASTTPALANAHVDALASSHHAHSLSLPPLSIDLPTFSLPDYVLHAPQLGYIESGIQATLSSLSFAAFRSLPSLRPNITLFRDLYDAHPPPAHPYSRASSAYSAAVQLYARSSQLDTAFTRYSRFGDINPFCHAGCEAVETAHHLFVDCPAFDHLRTSATTEVLRDTSEQLRAAETTPLQTEVVLRFTSALFSDSAEVWPQYSSAYYLGTMPSLPQSLFPANLPSQRLLTRVMQSWHLASIHLTSRIWSAYKRQFFPTASQYTKSPIILPPHLSHLLLP
ncbi:hypothetical protein BN946_scf184569.g33 [Trametes cinnabarina]|uniref:Endonuclease/exonuclease/phosphatase domain-containing protein n=1 Tax=Pycnoporus cinnabarinus TaxID=5643 RepID=A0A060S802_PYCCI|nr:hypothetical protein BN946_scf184569.g33 [Trametes cinnabarina]